MFLAMLAATFVVALVVSFAVARVFDGSIRTILERITAPEIAVSWTSYLRFAIYVVGISGGVNVYRLEKYINPRGEEQAIQLTAERWVLEIYRAVIGALQAIAWMLLVFFVVALLAYVIVRIFESRRRPAEERDAGE